MSERLGAVLTVIYLIFNEGYAVTKGDALVRADLCVEAIRLARLIRTLISPPPAEATALLALMLLHDSRRDARLDEAGDLVVLEQQDRNRWNHAQIAEALPLAEEAFRGSPGPFAVQAAIASLHCGAELPEDTDWPQILQLYDLLERIQPSPIVSLNRAVAVAMVGGPQSALAVIDELTAEGDLDGYYLCCIPREPICYDAWDLSPKRRRLTSVRSHWSAIKASAGFWSGGCATFKPRRRDRHA